MTGKSSKQNFLIGKNNLLLLILLQWIISAIYITIQYRELGEAQDIPYVVLILISAHLVFIVLKAQYTLLTKHESLLYPKPFTHAVFSNRMMTINGLIYGLIFFGGSYLANYCIDNEPVISWLRILLLTNTVIIGMGLYCLCTYFYYIVKVSKFIEVHLWNKDCDSLVIFSTSMRGILFYVTLIVAISIGCVPFSYFVLDQYILVFSVFCVIVLAAAHYIPLVAINTRMQRIKSNKLKDIGVLIEDEYENKLRQLKVGSAERVDLGKFEALELLYEKTRAIPLFFTLNLQSVKNFVMIILPIVFPYVAENYLKNLF